MIQDFQVFIKPAGASCNLRCSYCYYLKNRSLHAAGNSLMSDIILEKCIKDHFETSSDTIMFSWHGGEPMLAGIDFYRKALNYQKKYSRKNKTVLNGIQTNGTLIDEEWARFFSEEKFIVGISIDGNEELHDLNRRYSPGKPSFRQVIDGHNIMVKHGARPEILCVVNSVNVNHPIEIYTFFRSLGATAISFLPLVERMPGNENVTGMSVPSEGFGKFLSAIFDTWVENDIGKIKVQIFEEALRTAFNQDHTLCIFKSSCGGVPVIESNGDFYACDHYVSPDHKFGNIINDKLGDLLSSNAQTAFGSLKASTLPAYCLSCEVLRMCNGECPKNRFIKSPSGEPGLNYLCAGYKYFFNHCRPFIDMVSRLWYSEKS